MNGKVRQRVRAVDDRRDAALPRQPAQIADGEELPRLVRDVAEVQHLRLRRDRLLEPLNRSACVVGHGKIEARDLDLVAPRALVPRGQHAAVVLLGGDDLVARLEVEADLRDLQRLAGVARDGDLFRVGAEFRGQPPPGGFDVPLDQPAVIHRRLVGRVQIPFVRLVDDGGAGTGVAVIEVDERAIERERELDLAPVGFVGRDVLGRPVLDGRGRGGDLVDPVVTRGERRSGTGAGQTQHRTTAPHHDPSSVAVQCIS